MNSINQWLSARCRCADNIISRDTSQENVSSDICGLFRELYFSLIIQWVSLVYKMADNVALNFEVLKWQEL